MEAVIGTAGWSLSARAAQRFPSEGSALQRYAALFRGVEINSSFHRPHRPSTWARWAESVPAGFRFSVKLPKTVTHERRLAGCADPIARFLDEIAPLAEKLAVLLVQLPPKLAFEASLAEDFFAAFPLPAGAVLACEPRHPSWFEADAGALLERLRVARVAADPAVVPAAASPGGWRGLAYWRLHGSPVMYRSSYDGGRLDDYAAKLRSALGEGRDVWCMFDNTASSAATGDAAALMERI
jgi:uncharacterized protein YecE (DUF72 family)